ncbi:Glyoxalase-like domain protein [Pirellulimonas nuda]|uniref:Glyoxalase-like domain protein n=1 Tax=Pirellulimonas nuda TaxID=2528009 RepID=A0A518D751_9BACT|nr:VOC family protein [Pirellulimonas nuda]QDU87313.1 Glyoxalase-like domain protein [Pirellulimonas nuda]
MKPSSSAIPCLRYRDAPAAIKQLCEVLGFSEHLVVPGPDDTIVHAQLVLGGGMVMLGSATDSAHAEYLKLMKQPSEVGGANTQSSYLVVPDADAVLARVHAAGWKVLIEIEDKEYGGRDFTCADPEGHVWSVGTYDPWAGDV